MDALKKKRLSDAGIDVDNALERFMGNEALLDRFLNKFLADESYPQLTQAISNHDLAAAITASHSLKGVCGNLSMTQLYDLFTRQVAAFRAGDWETAVTLMDMIIPAFAKVCETIQKGAADA